MVYRVKNYSLAILSFILTESKWFWCDKTNVSETNVQFLIKGSWRVFK